MAVLNEIEIDGTTYTLFDINKIYPVGSIYLSASSTNPSSLFGGTWEQIKDKFLIGAGNSYSGGSTGGSTTHTHTNPTTGSTAITVDQMPSHSHYASTGGAGSHSHTLSVDIYGNPDGWSDYGRNYWNNNWGSSNPSTSPVGDHTHTVTVESTGSGQGHTHTMGSTGSTSNIPPYLAVYMWKRTA